MKRSWLSVLLAASLCIYLSCNSPAQKQVKVGAALSPDPGLQEWYQTWYILAYGINPEVWLDALWKVAEHGKPWRENFEALLCALRRDNVPLWESQECVLAAAQKWAERNRGKLAWLDDPNSADLCTLNDSRRILAKVCLGKLPEFEIQKKEDEIIGYDLRPTIGYGLPIPGAKWSGFVLPPMWEMSYEDVMAVLSTKVVLSRKDKVTPIDTCRDIEKATGREVRWYPQRTDLDMEETWTERMQPYSKEGFASVGDLLLELYVYVVNLHGLDVAAAALAGKSPQMPPGNYDFKALITKNHILIIAIPEADSGGARGPQQEE